jgi:hypothetical protein
MKKPLAGFVIVEVTGSAKGFRKTLYIIAVVVPVILDIFLN